MLGTTKNVGKTNSFKTAYLLGVSLEVLQKEYEEDYISSGYTNTFEGIPNALYLRELVRLRQLLFKNYSSFCKLTGGEVRGKLEETVHKTTEMLVKEYDFDVYDLIDKMTLCGFINELSRRINAVVYPVLKDMGIVHSESVGTIFKYPQFDKKSIIKHLSQIRPTGCYAFGIIMFSTRKVETYLPYMLKNDKNFYSTVYTMRNMRYSYEDDEAFKIKFIVDGTMQPLEKAIKEQVKPTVSVVTPVKVEKPVETVLDDTPTETYEDFDITDCRNQEPDEAPSYDNCLKCNKYPLEGIIKTDKKQVNMYVDCDNIDYFKFLAIISEMEKVKTVFKIKLFKDSKSSSIWDIAPVPTTKNIVIELNEVPRLINLKSMVDMAMSTEICKDVYKEGVTSVCVASSDSDFLGLVYGLALDDMSVIFDYEDTSKEYILTLADTKGVKLADISLIDTSEVSKKYKKQTIKNLFLRHLVTFPISRWSKSYCVDFILSNLTNESVGSITSEEIIEVVDEVRENITVSLRDNGYILKAGDIELVSLAK